MRIKHLCSYSSGVRVGVVYDRDCQVVAVGGGMRARVEIQRILRSMSVPNAPHVQPSASRIRYEAQISMSQYERGLTAIRERGAVMTQVRHMGRVMR